MIPDQSASQRWFSEAPGLSLEALQDESDVKVANWKCHETRQILFCSIENKQWTMRKKPKQRKTAVCQTKNPRWGVLLNERGARRKHRGAHDLMPRRQTCAQVAADCIQFKLYAIATVRTKGSSGILGRKCDTNSDEIHFDQNVAAFYDLSYFHNRKHVDTSVLVWRACKNVSFKVMPMLQWQLFPVFLQR